MHRRTFLQSGFAGLSLTALGPHVFSADKSAPPRTALIGCGWYGKADLLRLIQVAPVEVVGLCDVDKTMLSEAADIVSQRQKSQKRPQTFGDFRDLLKQTQPELVLIATP